MKKLYFFVLLLFCLSTLSKAQSKIYSTSAVAVDQYLRDSVHVLGWLDLNFPVDGKVFVHFNGIGYCQPLDRIILGANEYPDWDTNYGNVSFESTDPTIGTSFSHTRVFDAAAGPHSYYAVAHNYVDINGSGIATIYGTLTVEFIPLTEGFVTATKITADENNASDPIAFDSVTIQTEGPGKIELRLDGNIECRVGDVMVIAATDTKNWNYSDPFGALLEPSISNASERIFSNTRIFDIPGAGTYTYYAMADNGFEEEGEGYLYAYTHLNAKFYPATSENVIASKPVSKENFALSTNVTTLASIDMSIPKPGKVEVSFDGAIQSLPGNQIVLAASDENGYGPEAGHLTLQALDDDYDRQSFAHTQVYDVQPGNRTFYAVAQNYLGTGSTNVDIHGRLVVKFYPEFSTSTQDIINHLDFTISPNPVKDEMQISYDHNEVVNISIYDLQGRLMSIKNDVNPGESVSTETLVPGIYIVKASNGKERGVRKIVKE